MNKEDIKLVYSKKYNQYYAPIEFDDKDNVCKIRPHKKDKQITKKNIASYEDDEDWNFVIMWVNKTAEDYFVEVINSTNYKAIRRALRMFVIYGLTDSEIAMNELARWFKIGFDEVKSEEEKKVRRAIQRTYIKVCIPDTKGIVKDGYDQHIPHDIRNLAYKKGLIIERNDDYWNPRNKDRVAATGKTKESLQNMRDCGYQIVNTHGRIVAGEGFSLVDAQVVEFINKYNAKPDDLDGDYKLSLTKNQIEKIEKCRKILANHKMNIRNKNNMRFWIVSKNGRVIRGGINGMAYATFLRCVYSMKNKKGWK